MNVNVRYVRLDGNNTVNIYNKDSFIVEPIRAYTMMGITWSSLNRLRDVISQYVDHSYPSMSKDGFSVYFTLRM